MRKTRQAPADPSQEGPAAGRPLVLALSAVVAASALLAAVAVAASGEKAEAGRLRLSLSRMERLVNRQVKPPAARVAAALPDAADRLGRLREPASTAEAQVGIALGELQQMSALTYDPHYMPALVAAGRAFVAVTGQDPLTRTAINPEYLGLDRELAGNAAGAATSGRDAARALRGLGRLRRELTRARRRAARLERRLKRRSAQAAKTSKPR